MTTKDTRKYHTKEMGVFDLDKINNLDELKDNITENTEGHSTKYIFTFKLQAFERTAALSNALNQMTKSLKDRVKIRENVFKTEVERELKRSIAQLTDVVERYHNSKTFRDYEIFEPDLYKLEKEIKKAHEMIKNTIKLNEEVEEKEKTFLN